MFQISLSREGLRHFGATNTDPNLQQTMAESPRWSESQVHYNLFCGTVLALGNDQQRRPWAKNRTQSWGRLDFHELLYPCETFFGYCIVRSTTCCILMSSCKSKAQTFPIEILPRIGNILQSKAFCQASIINSSTLLRMAGRVTEVGSTGMLYADRSGCRPWSQKDCWTDCTIPIKWK